MNRVHEGTRILSKECVEDHYEIVAEMTAAAARGLAQYELAL
jgi:hypothetical protein